MRLAVVCLPGILVTICACGKGTTKASPVADAEPSASASATPPQPFRPRPEDLDLARLREPLKCTPGSKKPACLLVSDFEKGDNWNLDTIRGTDARYFGTATIIEKGQSRSTYYFLIVKKVPTNEVPAGDLPIKIAIRELDSNLKSENAMAPRFLRGLEHDDIGNKYNATATYLKTYAPSNWDGANVTSGVSAVLHAEGGIYVRESKTRRLYAIRLASGVGDATPGDGLYATLYPVSW